MLPNHQDLLDRFFQAADLAGVSLSPGDIEVEILPAPHRPTGLGTGKMGIYVFLWRGKTLKVGKAGPSSDARFRSQHYLPKGAISNLAASILKDGAPVGTPAVDEYTVGAWIKQNTDRLNFRMSADVGVGILNMLEAFLQLALNPAYEGFSSQRR